MKKLVFLSFFLLIFSIPISSSATEQTERVLVLFENEVDESLFDNEYIEVHHLFKDYLAVSATVPVSIIDDWQQNPDIAKIETEPTVKISGQTEGWGYKTVLAYEAKLNGWTGKGVKIGIIDTGVRKNHPDLQLAGGISFVSETASYEDDEGHGTHVAGIIGAKDNDIGVVGVAPDAELYAIKALNNTGYGKLADVIAGIQWAVENEMDIINLSLTSPQNHYLLEKAVNQAYNEGILVIAASGNSEKEFAEEINVLYPARYPSVIAVGSINQQFKPSTFSYYGPALEFVAPGENIYSTFSESDYSYMYGTSMASPYVAGIAALYKEAYPNYSGKELRQIMSASARDLGAKGRDPIYGYGLVQAPITQRVFIDVPTESWYADEIAFLYEQGIVTGYDHYMFLPEEPVTRAEAITMIGRALQYDETKRRTNFTDVTATHYASGYIAQASEEKIVNGYPDGSFQPNASIIRGDVAAMLQRAYDFTATSQSSFTDIDKKQYFYEPIQALYSNQITNGYPDQTFRPLGKITRGEFSVFLARVLDKSFQ